MSQKLPPQPPAAAEQQAERERPPTSAAHAARNQADSGQRNGETSSSSSPESGGLNGDDKRNGKSRCRRRKRPSNNGGADGAGAARKEEKKKEEKKKEEERLVGLHSECANVWLDRSAYERAESLYQCWLATSAGCTAKSKKPAAPAGKCTKSKWAGPQSPAGGRGDRVAPVAAESPAPLVAPGSLSLPSRQNRSDAARTPDEGYQSLAPTPVTPASPANGLPRLPAELLRGVWLEKPRYDRAEAAFYQNLYGNNSTKRPPHCASASGAGGAAASCRGAEHPQSLVEEEEEEEEEEVEEEKRAIVPPGKAEVFHALLPIQEEEEEPSEGPDKEEEEARGVGGVTPAHFVHPDSEPVWLDKWRYDAAEGRFHCARTGEAAAVVAGKKPRKTQLAPPAVPAPAPAPLPPSTTTTVDNSMTSVSFLSQENIWFDKVRYDEAERRFYEHVNGPPRPAKDVGANSILQDIARARENIQKSLAGLKTSLCSRGSGQASLSQKPQLSASNAADQGELVCRIKSLELENQTLNKVVESLRSALSKLECRVAVLEKSPAAPAAPAAPPAAKVPYTNGTAGTQQKSSAPVTQAKVEEDEDEDDVDLFGSDDDDEEAEKLKAQRLQDYAEKKAKKPALIAKSSILLDVKPWDDETDMAKLEQCVRSVQADGLLWGTSKLVPVGYGIKKLQIACVVEDDKVGTDMLEEEITKFEDYVQSVDVAAFNKI